MGIAADVEMRCTSIRDHLLARQLATQEEIDACYDQDGDEELRLVLTYGDLRSLHADRQTSAGTHKRSQDDEVLSALSDEPEVAMIGHGKPVSVYPKSFAALMTIARLGQRIDFLLEKTRELQTAGLSAADDLYARVDREVLFLYRSIVLGATTEGPTLPYDALSDIESFDTWVIVLTPADILTIQSAFTRVNAVRLAALSKLIRSETKERGPGSSWATFFSLRSDESHIPSPSLMRDHSLTSQMAAGLLAASAKIRAQEEAKNA